MKWGASPLWTVFASVGNTSPMSEKQAPSRKETASAREERLKAALKANMAKRKARARAMAQSDKSEEKKA